jgi:DNA invertase Pin-like site-specific DNA recombinase
MAPSLTPGWALYLRVSSEDAQTPERSFSMQQTEIRERLLAGSNLPVITTYRDIMTGTTFDRSGFTDMLVDARAGKFSHLAIYRVDRFGRDTAEGLSAGKELRRLGIHVVPAGNPSLDITTPDGWMMWTILLGFGEHEVAVLSKRSKDGMRDKLMQGHWCWKAPDGFVHRRRVINNKKSESWMEIDPERAPVVREAWDLLLTGEYSYQQICRILHDRGTTRANGRPWIWQKGGRERYAGATLGRMFHNPLYAGWIVSEGFDLVWGQVRSQAGAIVSDAEYAQAQRILEENNRRKHNTTHDYLLQNLAHLVVDGAEIPMQCCTVRRETRGYDTNIGYYFVPREQIGDHAESGVYLPLAEINAAVEELLSDVTVPPELLPEARRLYAAEVRDAVEISLEQRVANLRRELSDLLEQEKQYARLYAQGRLSDAAYDALAVEVRADIARAQLNLSHVERTAGDRIQDLDHAVALLARLPDAWQLWTHHQRREALCLLFKRIRVDVDGRIRRSPLRAPFAYLRDITRVIATDGAEAPPGSRSMLLGAPGRSQLEPPIDVLAATAVERPELLERLKNT